MGESIKISDLLSDSGSSSDINIKDILEIIKAIKELAQMQQQPQQQQVISSYQDNNKQQPQQNKPNAEEIYNQFITALEQLSLLYGENISVKEFKEKLKEDKQNLINMIRGAMK